MSDLPDRRGRRNNISLSESIQDYLSSIQKESRHRQKEKSVGSWSTGDVVNWLENKGLTGQKGASDSYRRLFRDNRIDGRYLLDKQPKELYDSLTTLGMKDGDARNLVDEFQRLRGNDPKSWRRDLELRDGEDGKYRLVEVEQDGALSVIPGVKYIKRAWYGKP